MVSYCIILSIAILGIAAHPQQTQPGPGACEEYRKQCVDGSSLAGQGASSGVAIFPNNPLPVEQVNMTAIQQMPYCEGLLQACESQNATIPAVPATPDVPEPPAPGGQSNGGGFLSSLRTFFHL
ncbi:uncharacterized protein LOC110855734 [Folsomia candida]|uniref:Uncharacterized protein n=1 Tax=Folsomia candida TaxID=158441 RepID=A0A226DP21_FOLCA|nr:uncharacterized protein LOC110855734 [Folsomia candida]OXA47285.1 hypothetical protein Fcan01_17863 [Folsomia candida]